MVSMTELTARIEKLESFLKEQKSWKDQYQTAVTELDKANTINSELTEKLKKNNESLEQFEQCKQLFSNLFLKDFQTAPPVSPSGPLNVNLEYQEMIVNIKYVESKPIQLTTMDQKGQIMYCVLNDLPPEGFITEELIQALQEHGWNIPQTSLAPHLGSNLPKRGLLIQIPNTKPVKYRVPTKVKINVVKGS